MKSWKLHRDDAAPTTLLALATDDPVIASIREWAERNSISGAHFHALGAVRRATLAWYDLERQEYVETEWDEQLEVCSLVGNVSMHDGETKVHAHCVLGRPDNSTVGGHLIEATVRPTLELVLMPGAELRREMDEAVGLPLLS